MFRKHSILLLLVIGMLCACKPRSVEQAQRVVAQADSLWHIGKMYGVDEGDSAILAQAYADLIQNQSKFPDEYAHACYHYGRLLRAKDNPEEAMQCFINATHTSSHDYHILGRIYSNMGSICHLAEEYQLSYDMYEKSANMFLQNGDSLLYYYGLNNMAFELAEQGKKDSVRNLLCLIRAYDNPQLLIKSLETEASLYQALCQYDSVIYIINDLQALGYTDLLGYMMKARAFGHIDQIDSALYYAQKVISADSHDTYQIPAYYILSHFDNTISIDSVLSLTSTRADIQKEWGIGQGKLSRAVQLLEQDLARKPDLRWLYTLVATLFVVTIIILSVIIHRRKQHQLLSQQKMEYARMRKTDIEISCKALHNSKNLKKDLDWDNYDSMCNIANARLGGIVDKLKSYPNITPSDIRLCILVLLDLSYEDIASMLNLSPKSIAKLKSLTAKKIGTTMKNLHKKLHQIACYSGLA